MLRYHVPMRMLLLTLALPLLSAVTYLTDKPGKWQLPWSDQTVHQGLRQKHVAAIRAAYAEADKMGAIFQRARALDPPMGCEVSASRNVELSSVRAGAPTHWSLLMILMNYFLLDGKVTISGEGPGVHVDVNALSPLIPDYMQYPFDKWSAIQVFPEPPRIGEVGGFPLYQSDFSRKLVVIPREGRPPLWKPVSQERALTLVIEGVEKQIEHWRKVHAKKPESFEFLTGQERMILPKLKAELEALTPEERAAQAWRGCEGNARLARPSFLCSGEPTGRRIERFVEPNEEYWDASLPPARPQLVILDVMMRDDKKKPYRHKLAQPLIDSLDWKALGELVNPPR